MKQKYKNLNPLWIKAALLGSIWGSIEIIIGSFLHNLRIPLAGTILSAIGVSLLVGGRFLWKENGLIWRAGVVCALMKSISPSAVILGPMIGIITESIVLEIIIRLSRGNTLGILIGGAITTCLPFLQNIISLIITYGFNIAILYVEVYKFATKNIGVTAINAYQAIGILFLLYAMFGIFAAILGIAIGKKAAIIDFITPSRSESKSIFSLNAANSSKKFSTLLLITNVIAIPLVLLAIGKLSLIWSSSIVMIYTIFALFLYPNLLKRFYRPKIWIELIIITSLAGLLLGNIPNRGSEWTWSGLIAGIQMSLRALFMVIAFNIISIELRNPKIIGWFLHIGFGKIANAMEVAFDALPTAVSLLEDQRRILRHPITSLSQLLAIAKNRLEEIEKNVQRQNNIFVLTGDKGNGKSTLLLKLVNEYKINNLKICGIISPAVHNNFNRIGYDVMNIQNKNKVPLCRIDSGVNKINEGGFLFFEDGINFGNSVLDLKNLSDCKLVIIDEVGPLELNNKGWSDSIDKIINQLSVPVLLVIRESLIDRVKERWQFIPKHIWKIQNGNSSDIYNEIVNTLINDNV